MMGRVVLGRKRTSATADPEAPAPMVGTTAVAKLVWDGASNAYILLQGYFGCKDARASATCSSQTLKYEHHRAISMNLW